MASPSIKSRVRKATGKAPARKATGNTASVALPPALMRRVDSWAKHHKFASRAEAIRELLQQALAGLPRRPDIGYKPKTRKT